ncbi:hypothetical protein [Salinibaculum salinum]|uniref:hypothetical protein n=1 Tax=Salinibaculum salinum TaxID=3131996 RepID=UPI0030EEFE93
MARQTPLDRRTILQILASLLTLCAGTGAVTATDSRAATDTLSGGQTTDSATDTDDTDDTSTVSGFYGATVDRIVDGEHVVVLIEADGEVIKQFVIPREEYPTVEEGTRLFVWIDDGGMSVLWRW